MNAIVPKNASVRVRRGSLLIWVSLIVGILLIAGIALGPIMSRVEQPKYSIVAQAGSIEIRDYAGMIVAATEVSGERKAAIQEGFQRIAGYIFGANKPNTKIAMTAPVQQQANQKIEMTAPVTEQAGGNNRWTVRFIMPANWTLETLPQPNDARVSLDLEPSKRMLVVRFSGLASENVIKARTAELRDYAATHEIRTAGEPVLAFYNPPWTLPFLRRNEIMLEVQVDKSAVSR